MITISRLLRGAAALLAIFAFTAHADEAVEAPFISKMFHVSYDVDKEGRATQEVTTRFQLLQESALDSFKTYSFSFSTSIQTGEVLEAYTLKKDGRKITVPPGNYQRQTNGGRGNAGPFFSDFTRISVVYPELAVGDAVHIHYRTVEKEPMFPGQFSVAHRFSPYAAQEDVRVTVRAPRDMKLRHESHFVKFSESEQDGKRVMEWRYSNPKARDTSDEDEGLWSTTEIPGVLVSTFPSYEAIAQAYGSRALPKAAPTPRIQKLARSIVEGEAQPVEKARKLYEWVSRNITYGGNCIGTGAVVPRDVDVVLDNKMGDCKDHATLLQALLAAESITVEQVLINAGSDYDLPDVPVVSMVNHVINYLPTWGTYLDATAKDVPFGHLPEGEYSKPVIHVRESKALAKIPGFDHLRNQQQLQMMLKIAENGSASGTMNVKVKGPQAAVVRSYMRELRGQQERDFVKNSMGGGGWRARGTLERGNIEGLGDAFEFTIRFEIDNFLRNGSTGSFYFAPVMGTPLSVMNFAGFEEKPAPKRRQLCHGFHSSEEYEYDLPPNIEVLSMPEDAEFKGSLVDYKATYKRAGAHVTIQRSLDDKTPGSVCEPGLFADFLKQAVPVGENLRTQVLFKRKR